MKKLFTGYIITSDKGETLFEHVALGMITYYKCRMKIPTGKYKVVLKNNVVVSCWKQKKFKISRQQIQRAFEKIDLLTKNWKF